MTSTELAPSLPNPVYAPEETTAEDISLPRIKVGENQSDRVGNKKDPVFYGDIFTETSNDDPSPTVLAKGGDGVGDVTDPPILFYMLAPVRISYSWNDKDSNEFVVAGSKDPRTIAQLEAFGHKGSDKWIPRKGYNLLVALPEFPDESTARQVPFKLLLKGMSSQAYRHLDTELRKSGADAGGYWNIPFHLTAKQSKKGTYNFNVWQVARADIPDKLAAEYRPLVEGLVGPACDIALSASAIDSTSAPAVATDAPSID